MNKCDFTILNFDSIDSTSTYLKRTYKEQKDLTMVFASYQTMGHGRMKRVWVSPKGESLLFSILFKNKNIIDNFSSLSLLGAVTVFRFLSKYVSNVSIKWPNDVYVNNKKICGILLESISYNEGIEALVIGIGININTKNYPSELINKATSLYLETNKTFDLKVLKDDLRPFLEEMVNLITNNDKEYLKIVRNNNYLKNKVVKAIINEKEEEVVVLDINDDNTLLVKKDIKTYSLSMGEVTLHEL